MITTSILERFGAIRKPRAFSLLTGTVLSICLTWAMSIKPPRNASAQEKPSGRLDIEAADLSPGLLGLYRCLEKNDTPLIRVDPKPAFYLGHSSPHPRIAPGPFEVVWTGVILIKDSGPISFDAFVGGELSMDVDGVSVLAGRGMSDTTQIHGKKSLERRPGIYRVKIQYRSLAKVSARLQIWWQGPGFTREPLPPWHLSHIVKEDAPPARQEEMAARGRLLVGQLGCARCHQSALPGVTEPPPGPSLADIGGRVHRDWLLRWLNDPAKIHADSRMPALFTPDRAGFVERWLIADHLLGNRGESKPADSVGDHRAGRLTFISIGCAACHQLPDIPRRDQADLERIALRGLGERMPPEQLAAFLANPQGRYPDGRMPRLPVTPSMARDLAAYLLKYCHPAAKAARVSEPTLQEIAAVVRRLRSQDRAAAATTLLHDKGCVQCHPGLGPSSPADVPLNKFEDARGCLSGKTGPRFSLAAADRKAILAYLKVAALEKNPSLFESRQRHLARAGCVRCHQRDSDRPPPIETAGSTLGGGFLQDVPFQRTPRLTNPHQKFTRSYLVAAVREGATGLRPARYSYRMPAFGHDAETLVQALAEADGELPAGPEPQNMPASSDPTLGSMAGPLLAGFQGYACVSCHIWNGQSFSQPDPGAIGTDLTRVAGRIRRAWFDRFLEDPARSHPGTPMPAIFFKGKPASLRSVLDGDPVKQKEALWSYFTLGKDAPTPRPPPPLAVTPPAAGEGPLVAQIPIYLPAGGVVESISVLYGSHDLMIYDLGTGALHSLYNGAQILRHVQGRLRTFTASGKAVMTAITAEPVFQLVSPARIEAPRALLLEGYDRLKDGVRIRGRVLFASGNLAIVDSFRLVPDGGKRRLFRELRITGIPQGRGLEVKSVRVVGVTVAGEVGTAKGTTAGKVFRAVLHPDSDGKAAATIRYDVPPAEPAPILKYPPRADEKIDGTLDRPGYRAIAYPRPKTASGADLVMPGALAVHPRDGRVFVASMKLGEIFVLVDPAGDGKNARFKNYARGLFEEAFGLWADDDALYVLHRRNLTKMLDSDGDGRADRFDRVALLPHGMAGTYDYGYGPVRDKTGAFVFSYAPYANQHLPGSGGALRLVPGHKPREVAFGFRNPFGWCVGPEGEVFFTDNQGEWVATNKLCHLVEGRYYGFPNPAQMQHKKKPSGKAAVWVPYGWARSINGVAHDNSGGKFGPFAGQVFLAELMFGGAVIRANLEKVNGEYQGACFPFWGKGLLGPLTLAFDPRGHLYVGGITEPGWMAQPDRGALFRIDFTGQVPFEMQSIHVLPRGFRIVFTAPVSPETANKIASYHIEHYRYEYTGAYGSPELDRTKVPIERVELSADRRSVELSTRALVKGRVYMIRGNGVRSAKGEALVHPVGAYTLNEIPRGKTE